MRGDFTNGGKPKARVACSEVRRFGGKRLVPPILCAVPLLSEKRSGRKNVLPVRSALRNLLAAMIGR